MSWRPQVKAPAKVEEAQLGTLEGPCLECFTTGQIVEASDLLEHQDRWPRFAVIAAERRFRADHAFPLRLRGETLGVLNLFSERSGPLSDQDVALVQAMADIATISIVQNQTIRKHAALSEQLQHALDSRVLIEQAKGVIAQQRGVPIDEAFGLIRQHARNNGARLHTIAERIVSLQLNI